MTRGTLLAGLIAVVALSFCVGCAHSSTPKPLDYNAPVEQSAIDAAVDRGLDWLVAHRNQDGLWHDEYCLTLRTSCLAGMAMLSKINSGGAEAQKYTRAIKDIVGEIVHAAKENDGYVNFDPNGGGYRPNYQPAYDNALALVFLIQALQSDILDAQEKSLAETATRQITHYIQMHQNSSGAWRQNYIDGVEATPSPMNAQALILARDAGFAVKAYKIDFALEFADWHIHVPPKDCQPDPENFVRNNMRLAGFAVAELVAGEYLDPANLRSAILYAAEKDMIQHCLEHEIDEYRELYDYQTGLLCLYAGGEYQRNFFRMIAVYYLADQTPEGCWPEHRRESDGSTEHHYIHSRTYGIATPAYRTAVACLILQMPHRALPMYKNVDSDAVRSKLQLEN